MPIYTATHCRDTTTNTVGCFLFDSTQAQEDKAFKAISPVFNNLVELFDYCRDSNITPDCGHFNFNKEQVL